jgi:DNA repair exonuclease SbcCD ATPase subunit
VKIGKTGRRNKSREELQKSGMTEDEKYCPGCGQIHSKSEFQKNSSSKDGLQHYCRHCQNKAAKEGRQVVKHLNDFKRKEAKKQKWATTFTG